MRQRIDNYLGDLFDSYDTIDLLATLSALNLEFENQNKNVLTTYATMYGLFSNKEKSKPKPSSKTIKNLIKELNNSFLKSEIDPAESSFFEFVFYDAEYGVFNGINASSAFFVNSILELFLYRTTDLNTSFKKKALKMIKAILAISDRIFKATGICFPDIRDHKLTEDIIYPLNVEQLKNCVLVEKSFIQTYLDENEINDYLICSLDGLDLEKAKMEYMPFFYHFPFLDCGDSYLVLDPTSLCTFIKYLCIRLSEEFDCRKAFERELNLSICELAFEKCKMISGITSSTTRINDGFIVSDQYESECYKHRDGRIILLTCLFVDVIFDLKDDIDKYINNCLSILSDKGINKDNVYLIVLYNSISLDPKPIGSQVRIKNQPIFLSCSDVATVFINEKDNHYYLISFIDFMNFYFSKNGMSMVFSTLNLMAALKEMNYDFYINDDIRIKKMTLNMAFDYIYPYCVTSLEKRLFSVAIFSKGDVPIPLVQYEDNIYFPNPATLKFSGVNTLYLKINNTNGFWFIFDITSNEALQIGRVLAYWINQIQSLISVGLKENYYVRIKEGSKMGVMQSTSNSCELFYSLDYMSKFSNSDNSNELIMVNNILKSLGLMNDNILDYLRELSLLPNKKVIYILESIDAICCKPLTVPLIPIKTDKIYESIFDDMVGEYLVDDLKLEVGVIQDPNYVSHKIVEYLFNKFEIFLSKFNWRQSIDLAYLYAEDTLQNLLLFQANMQHRIALYPEHSTDVQNDYNDINTKSVTLKFVVEYLATIRPNGSIEMCPHDIQYAMSLCNSIIKWARIGDGVYYRLIDKLIILKSSRIGYDHTLLTKFNTLISDVASYDTSHKLDFEFKESKDWPYKEEFNKYFLLEHGFTTDQLMMVVVAFNFIGSNQTTEIKTTTKSILISTIHEAKLDLNESVIDKIVGFLSLTQREVFYDKNIKPRELHPWKYNRYYSLLRRPIIKNGDTYLWGDRLVNHAYLFIMQVIQSGKEHSLSAGGDSVNTINGKILDYEGNRFNDYCFEYLKSLMPNLIIKKSITSINNIKISDENGNDLGDIDIFAIDIEKRRIYLIETKNFFYSRDFAELDIEIKEMFCGTGKEKSFLKKEIRRVDWVKNHISDVIHQYKLDPGEWKVLYTFLTNKPLISKEFNNTPINSINLKNINLLYLRKLK